MRKAAQPQPGTRKAAQRQHAERGCAAPNAEGGAASAERGAGERTARGRSTRTAARGHNTRSAGPRAHRARPRARSARRRRLDHRSSIDSLRYHPATAQAWDRWAMIRYRVNFPAYGAGKLTQIGIMDVAAAAKRGWDVRDSRTGTADAGPARPGPGQEMRVLLAPARDSRRGPCWPRPGTADAGAAGPGPGTRDAGAAGPGPGQEMRVLLAPARDRRRGPCSPRTGTRDAGAAGPGPGQEMRALLAPAPDRRRGRCWPATRRPGHAHRQRIGPGLGQATVPAKARLKPMS